MHPELESRLRGSRLLWTPLMILIGAATISAELYFRSAHGVPIVFGLIFIRLAWFASKRFSRWAERADWLLKSVPPVPMRVSFREGVEGGLLATLVPLSNGKGSTILFEWPGWDVKQYEGAIVQVHLDPKIDDLVIIATDSGVIWPLDQYRRIPILRSRRLLLL